MTTSVYHRCGVLGSRPFLPDGVDQATVHWTCRECGQRWLVTVRSGSSEARRLPSLSFKYLRWEWKKSRQVKKSLTREERVELVAAVFKAKWSSKCPACSEQIDVGDAATWNDDRVVHEGCGSAALLEEGDPLRAAYGVCPRCYMALPASGVCGVCD